MLLLQCGQLLFRGIKLLQHGVDLADDIGFGHVQPFGDGDQIGFELAHPFDGRLRRQCFDPAHTGRHAAFGVKQENADFACTVDVGATAEFDTVVRDIDNPHDIGPLTFERQVKIIDEQMEDALARGARLLTGGGRDGLFMAPTVVVDVDHSMKLMREETFGPIMPIMKVRDEAEAIRLANDSDYGLSASVWSEDLERARRVAEQLEVGSVVVNDTIAHYAVSELPFGGVKKSGTARTHGRQDVLQFTQTKAYGVGGTPVFLDVAAQLRQPQKYHLMSAIFHGLYGVTPEQRLRAVGELGRHLGKTGARAAREAVSSPSAAQAAAGAVAGAALAVGLALLGRRK